MSPVSSDNGRFAGKVAFVTGAGTYEASFTVGAAMVVGDGQTT